MPILIEVPDMESAEAILKLTYSIQANHPDIATKMTTQITIQFKGSVTKSESESSNYSSLGQTKKRSPYTCISFGLCHFPLDGCELLR